MAKSTKTIIQVVITAETGTAETGTGFFNSKPDRYIRVFNKKCKLEDWQKAGKPNFIYRIELTFLEGDELKERSYQDACKIAWDSASEDDKELLKELPNFSAKVFKEITGIDVNKKGEN